MEEKKETNEFAELGKKVVEKITTITDKLVGKA